MTPTNRIYEPEAIMSVSFFAEYSDGSRHQVVYDPSERKTYLRTTSDNKMDVPYQVSLDHRSEEPPAGQPKATEHAES